MRSFGVKRTLKSGNLESHIHPLGNEDVIKLVCDKTNKIDQIDRQIRQDQIDKTNKICAKTNKISYILDFTYK